MSQGNLIAAAGGVLLFIFLFLPWFGIDTGAVPEGVEAPDDSLSGWEGQNTFDVYLLITALVAIAAALTAGGAGLALPGMTLNGATALLGGVGTVLILWLLIFDFPDGFDRKVGIFLGLIAVAGIAVGAWMALQEGAGGTRVREPREPEDRF